MLGFAQPTVAGQPLCVQAYLWLVLASHPVNASLELQFPGYVMFCLGSIFSKSCSQMIMLD